MFCMCRRWMEASGSHDACSCCDRNCKTGGQSHLTGTGKGGGCTQKLDQFVWVVCWIHVTYADLNRLSVCCCLDYQSIIFLFMWEAQITSLAIPVFIDIFKKNNINTCRDSLTEATEEKVDFSSNQHRISPITSIVCVKAWYDMLVLHRAPLLQKLLITRQIVTLLFRVHNKVKVKKHQR